MSSKSEMGLTVVGGLVLLAIGIPTLGATVTILIFIAAILFQILLTLPDA